MFITHAETCEIDAMAAIGQDQDSHAGSDVVNPGIEQRTGLDCYAKLFTQLADDGIDWVFAELELAAGKFPFAAIVAEKQDVALMEHDPFHRDRKPIGAVVSRERV